MCSVPMKLWPTSSDSRRAASRAAFAPGENGIAPGDGSSRSPTIAANPVAHDVHVQARLAQHASCDAWLLAHQPQQQVFGADVVVAACTRLVLRQHDDLARALGKALEHPPSIDSPDANAKPRHGQP